MPKKQVVQSLCMTKEQALEYKLNTEKHAVLVDHLRIVFDENTQTENVVFNDISQEFEANKIYFIIGDSGVGKTGLVRRFIQNTFNKNTKATVGVEFISNNYRINNKIIKIEIWDTAGQER